MTTEMNWKDDMSASVRYANTFGNKQYSGSRNTRKPQNVDRPRKTTRKGDRGDSQQKKLCGACFRANKQEYIYTSHDIHDCKFLSKEEKAKMFKTAARLLNADEDDNSDYTDLAKDENEQSEEEESS